MSKTKIEWVKNPDGSQGYSWNPIQGLCPMKCYYCYARKIYKRFKLDPILTHIWIKPPKKPSGVFVCSTMELFHPDIPKEWRDIIFEDIKSRPKHRFYILTKMPENIDRSMPGNVWLGVSVTENNLENYQRIVILSARKARVRFVSFEPLLGHIDRSYIPALIDWVIVGKLTGHGKKHDPPYDWVYGIVNTAKKMGIPIFLKENLREIWGEKLIQEWPK